MKQEIVKNIRRLCILAGAGLLMVAGGMLLSLRNAGDQLDEYASSLLMLIPEPQGAVLEERLDNTMPVLSLEGTDFIGILEMPRYDSVLPACAQWGKIYRYPSCLAGSVYDGSIQIGGTTQTGQFDFFREILVGDSVFFTDVAGNRYAYTVADLRYEKHADQTTLQRKNADLTLFIKNVYAFEYLIVFCEAL